MPVRNKTAFSAAALAACALVFGAQQEATRDINKTLVLRAGQRLRVENKFGPVNVREPPAETSRFAPPSASLPRIARKPKPS